MRGERSHKIRSDLIESGRPARGPLAAADDRVGWSRVPLRTAAMMEGPRWRRPGSRPTDAPGHRSSSGPAPPATQDRASARGPPRGCRLCGRRPRRCGLGTERRGPWRVVVVGFGRAGAGSESPSMGFGFGTIPISLSLSPHTQSLTLSLSLSVRASVQFIPLDPNPKPNQASSRYRIAEPSSRWPLRQFSTATVPPATAVPLAWIRLWRALGTVRCCLMRCRSGRFGRSRPGMSSLA